MSNDIRIRGMLLQDYKELKNIAKNKDISFPLFLKQLLTTIADECENIETNKIEYSDDIKVMGVSKKTHDAIIRKCHRLSVPVSTFLKIELNRLKCKYPNALKERPFGD